MNAIELLGPALVLAVVVVLPVRRASIGVRIVATIAGAALAFIPLGPASLGAVLLGTVGPLSAAAIVMLATLLVTFISDGKSRTSCPMLVCLIAISIAYYPFTIGLTRFDPYEFGYGGIAVPALMLGLVMVGWIARVYDVACWVGLAALLYICGAYDSTNLWDYLIFPTDPFYAGIVLAIRAFQSRRDSRHDNRAANFENSATTRS